MKYHNAKEYADMAHKANLERKILTQNGGKLELNSPAISLEEAKAAKENEMDRILVTLMADLLKYGEEERASWPFKLAEAEELMYDPEADAPMLRAELEASGSEETIVELAQKVHAKNAIYKRMSGYLGGQKKRFLKELEALAATEGVTMQEILDYNFEYHVPEIEVEEVPQVESPESEPLTLEPDVKEPSKSLFQRLFRTA